MPSSSIENRIGALTPTTSKRVPSQRARLAGEPRPSGKSPPALRGSALPLHERGPLQARFCTRRPKLLGARPVALRV